jgi:TusA-related sulfurtransferase
MWNLGRWNNFYQIVELVDWRDTEEEVRETLQIWISDEYANKDIESFSEEQDGDTTIITIDGDEYCIWEEE